MIQTFHSAVVARKNAGGSGPSWLVKQGFETPTTGYDNGETWVENVGTDGIVDPVYTADPLVGTQSLRLTEATGGDVSTYNQIAGGPYNYLEGYAMIKIKSWPAANATLRLLILFGSTLPNLGGVRYDSINSGADFQLRATIGGTHSSPTVDSFPLNTLIHVWWKTSIDTDLAEVWWNTSATKPADGSNKYASVSGTATVPYSRLYAVCDRPDAVIVFDKIRVLNGPIGSDPT